MYHIILNTDCFLVYEGGTLQGSSGSPILKEVNNRLKLVGLHRKGHEKDPKFNLGSLFCDIIHHVKKEELERRKYTTYCT